MRKRELATALKLATISSLMACGAAFAADADPSLDQMWTDPGVSDKKPSAQTEAVSSTGAAPLCSLETIKSSALIKTGGWPGIGPFKADGNEYVDAGLNRLKLESQRDKVTSAELRLNNQNRNTAIFNLEMSADFLLQSLGAKEARISDFNGQLEKARTKLLSSTATAPLNLNAGSYLVNMHPEPEKNSDKYSFIIRVSSKDAGSDLVKRTGGSSTAAAADTAPDTAVAPTEAPTKIASIPTPSTSSDNGWDTAPKTTAPIKVAPKTNVSTPVGQGFDIERPKTGGTKTSTAVTPPSTPKTTAPATTTSTSSSSSTSEPAATPDTGAPEETPAADGATSMKDTFKEVIANWQKLKKVAVRSRDTSELNTVLSGRALVRQSDAIKWLQTNKKYYDMTPKTIVVDRFTETVKGQKYAVYAQVKESSKYMDEPTGQVIKDSEDTYNVNYTIEKSGDKWLISDSAILTPPKTTKTK